MTVLSRAGSSNNSFPAWSQSVASSFTRAPLSHPPKPGPYATIRRTISYISSQPIWKFSTS